MFEALFVTTGVLWTLAYALIIRRGFRDRTYGMPAAALCANLSWEALFAFVWPQSGPQVAVNATWFVLDLVLLYQFLRFGPAEHPGVSRKALAGAFLLGLATAFPIVYLVSRDLNQGRGGYAAFGMNLLMSILFVTMLRRRGSLRGQSLAIALAKLAGTVPACLAAWLDGRVPPGTLLLPFLFAAVFVWDLVYVVEVVAQARREGLSPWRL